jgi:hypothetical protein
MVLGFKVGTLVVLLGTFIVSMVLSFSYAFSLRDDASWWMFGRGNNKPNETK